MGFKRTALYQDMTPVLLFASVFSSMGAFTFGYDNNWWGGVMGSRHFNLTFGSGTKLENGVRIKWMNANDQSAGTALGTAGIMIGCMIAPFINERYGRKASFMSLAVIAIVGSVIMACSTIKSSFWMLVAGKIIVNSSVGIASAVTGVYQSECAPHRIRGALTNAYTVFNNTGTLLANIVMFGVHAKMNSSVWLVPIGLQFLFPIIILIVTPFLPESPRWLVGKGRIEDAFFQLRRLRGRKPTDDELHDQLQEVKDSLEHERANQSRLGWLQLFRGQDLRRTLVACGMLCLQQGQGISFTNNYLNITMLNLGFTNTYELLVALYTGKLVITFLGFYLPDRVGRRPMALVGACFMGSCMFIMAAVATATNNKPTGSLGSLTLAAIFIWVLTYSPTWGALPWTIAAEISSQQLRAKTLAVAAWSGYAVGLINNLVVPYIQGAQYGNLQGQITYIFGGFSVAAIIFAYFFIPELKGRTLEELDMLYEANVSARKFASYDLTALKAERAAQNPHGHEEKEGSVYHEEVGNRRHEASLG
ncbi:hypothetical protein I302_105558 [Kwoniella bestiolae CBS 10118]|uniref:Major facilitator superfamily (MFS) profile domain-containing protein n=1 Tax=Kwoniella bestiolae CBS 10118 TaxID=1296100 RepID=A0A1B9FTH0_9TREE|nr:hypothetical protein I302_08841 [Kwoniella bestiolae CBS 10118]OCF22060.1 hypothetical protein I302_08841 [Kwoniella bestiolae CBS 10118]